MEDLTYCSYCRGFKVEFIDPEGKKLIKCKACNGTGKKLKKIRRNNCENI